MNSSSTNSSTDSSTIRLPRFKEEETVYSDAQIMADLERRYARDWAAPITASGGKFYVFAYGSLLFRPDFDYAERHIACVRGFRRRFSLWSTLYRGTMERPGLVLGLDYGGCCWGIAYRLHNAAPDKPCETMKKLWRREMFTDAYEPRALNATAKEGEKLAPCLGFVLNHASSQYAGDVDERTRLYAIAGARGTRGDNRDYLLATQRSLAGENMRCSHTDKLAKSLAENSAENSAEKASRDRLPT